MPVAVAVPIAISVSIPIAIIVSVSITVSVTVSVPISRAGLRCRRLASRSDGNDSTNDGNQEPGASDYGHQCLHDEKGEGQVRRFRGSWRG
jgi:hypothetical protein